MAFVRVLFLGGALAIGAVVVLTIAINVIAPFLAIAAVGVGIYLCLSGDKEESLINKSEIERPTIKPIKPLVPD